MSQKEYRWHVNILKDIYPYLKLTFEQAEQLYLMEQQTNGLPHGNYFTDWERLDFELATMQRILSAGQLARYLPDHAEAVGQQLTARQQEWGAHFRQRWEHHHGPIRGFVYEAPFDAKKHRRQWHF